MYFIKSCPFSTFQLTVTYKHALQFTNNYIFLAFHATAIHRRRDWPHLNYRTIQIMRKSLFVFVSIKKLFSNKSEVHLWVRTSQKNRIKVEFIFFARSTYKGGYVIFCFYYYCAAFVRYSFFTNRSRRVDLEFNPRLAIGMLFNQIWF